MVMAVSEAVQRKPVDGISFLAEREELERARLAMRAAGVAAFDWTLADDRIIWGGAIEIVPHHRDTARLERGQELLNWLSPDARNKISQVLLSRDTEDTGFEIEAEAASAMGSIWLVLVGTRLAG